MNLARTRIHVRRDLIAIDKRDGTNSRAVGVETTGMRKRYGRSVSIKGPAKVIYSPGKPLNCGARAWIETFADVVVHG